MGPAHATAARLLAGSHRVAGGGGAPRPAGGRSTFGGSQADIPSAAAPARGVGVGPAQRRPATTADTALANLREALHAHDEQRVREAYGDDAVVIAYSERNRPSSARRLTGRGEIESWIHDVMSRNLEHRVSGEVVSGDRFAFTETCVYPSGEHVVGNYVCEVRDGRIVRQVGTEAWDE